MALPVVLIAGLLFAGPGSKDRHPSTDASSAAALSPVTVSAPPSSDPATLSACAKLVGALPLSLGTADVRAAESSPSSPDIVAWGEPAIVLRCGVDRPAALVPDATSFVVAVDGVNLLPAKHAGATVWTVIDRAVYVDVTVPSSYRQPPLGPIATAVGTVLPQVCKVPDAAGNTDIPDAELCTRRR